MFCCFDVLTARNSERLERAASELGALRTAAFDANDPASLERFFLAVPTPIDHVMVTGPGPHYWPLMEIEFEQARLAISEHILLALWVACNAAGKIRPGGTLLLWAAPAPAARLTGSRSYRRSPLQCPRSSPASPSTSHRSGLISSPQASLTRCYRRRSLGEDLDARRDQLRPTLPIRRVVGPAEVAALTVHIMINETLTGTTYDIDGGQQLVAGSNTTQCCQKLPVSAACAYLTNSK